MTRIKLDLPDQFIFSVELPVRVSDLNYGGHVGNDKILSIMQEGRVLFYRSLGFKDEVSLEGSIGQIIADSVVVYKAESFLGDILTIQIAVSDFNKYGFDMFYKITCVNGDKEIAIAKTGIVCFDYVTKKVARIPIILIDKLKASMPDD